MDYNACRYCQRHQNTGTNSLKLQKNPLTGNKIIEDHFRNFSMSRRRTGACENCSQKLEVINNLRDLLQIKQQALRKQTNTVPEPLITVKIEAEDEEYKDPLICLETNTTTSNLTSEMIDVELKNYRDAEEPCENCDLCGLNLPTKQLKLHIEKEHKLCTAGKPKTETANSSPDIQSEVDDEKNPQDFLQVEMEDEKNSLIDKGELLKTAIEKSIDLDDGKK